MAHIAAVSTLAWCIIYLVQALFWLWLARWGGAHSIRGWPAEFLFAPGASRWEADVIRLVAWLALVASTSWFVVGLFDPRARW